LLVTQLFDTSGKLHGHIHMSEVRLEEQRGRQYSTEEQGPVQP